MNTVGLSSCHISPYEPEHPVTELARYSNEERFAVRRCRDFRGEKFIWACGGNFVRLQGMKHTGPVGPVADRSLILGFSEKSRRRLLELVNSLDRDRLQPERIWFLTLTYPGQYPKDPKVWKKHLDQIGKRIRRAWGPIPVIWKLEAQKRGAPHFHMLAFVSPERASVGLSDARIWLANAWYECVDSGDLRHLAAGTQIDPIRSWNGVSTYAAKYMGKETGFDNESLVTADGEPVSIGRFWGVWNRDELPMTMQEAFIPDQVARRVRRGIRRYVERQGHKHKRLRKNCSFTAFVPFKIFNALVFDEMTYFGWEKYFAWKGRRGLAEHRDPFQEYQDFLLCCGEEFAAMKRDELEAA